MATEEILRARVAAIAEVETLLQSTDDLKRLPALKEEFTAQQKASKARLSTAVAAHVETTKSGLDMLHRAGTALDALRTNFNSIEQLCEECRSLIDFHDKIARLATMHSNIRKTLNDIESIASLPVTASEAETLLADDSKLLAAHQRIAFLQGTALKAQRALESGGACMDAKEAAQLASYFQRVKHAANKLEERLWSIIRNHRTVVAENPALLVTAVQLIEIQELTDAELIAAGLGASPLRKAWKKRCLDQLSMAIQDSSAPLLQRCSQLMAAGSDTEARLDSILEEAQDFVCHLVDCYDYVAPCFPPDYQIFSHIAGEYHRQLGLMIDFIGLCSDNLANGDIIKVMKWVSTYKDSLAALGIEDEDASFEETPESGISLLVECYVSRITSTLEAWLANIVDGDFQPGAEPKVSATGQVWTPGAVDFFRILNEQVAVVSVEGLSILIARVGGAIAKTMLDFHAAQCRKLKEGLSLEMICALINNNVRCHRESFEFASQMELASGGESVAADVEAACRGFIGVAQEGADTLVLLVFSDPGLEELFATLHCTEEWRWGRGVGNLIATLNDFVQDFERMLEAEWFKRVAEALFEDSIAFYSAALLTQLKGVGEAEVKAIAKDVERLKAFFSRYIPVPLVDSLCQIVEDLSEFATSDSIESFVLSYSTLLTTAPGVTPALLGNVLAARVATDKDMSRSDAKEVIESCRDVYAQQQRKLETEEAYVPSSTRRGSLVGRDASYKAAVVAVRRKPSKI